MHDFLLVEDPELAASLGQIALRDDVVPIENAPRLVAADSHRDTLRYAGTHQVTDAAAPQIVKDHSSINHFHFRLWMLAINSGLRQNRLARRIEYRLHPAKSSLHTSSVPCFAKSLNLRGPPVPPESEADALAFLLALGVLLPEPFEQLRRYRNLAAFVILGFSRLQANDV